MLALKKQNVMICYGCCYIKECLIFFFLATALPIVGPVAKAFNFQIEDTLALLGKLADAGFDASMSATALVIFC